MGLKRHIQYIKHDLATSDFDYVMPFNKSWEILEIGVVGAAAGQGVTIIINGVSMMYMPSVSTLMTIGAPPYVDANMVGYFEQLRRRFPDVPNLRVCPGEKISLSRISTAGACVVYVWYKEWETPDTLNPADPGGSGNSIKMFNSFISQIATIGATATEEHVLDISYNPSGYRDFPVPEIVQAGFTYDFLALSVSADLTSAPNTVCDGIRIWHQDESILGIDEDYVPIDTFPVQDKTIDKRLFMLPTPRSFVSNELMKVELKYTNSGGAPESVIGYVGLVFRIYPV